jgi:beta-galactosidase
MLSTAMGIDADTVRPARRPTYTVTAPKIMPKIAPKSTALNVNSGTFADSGMYGRNSPRGAVEFHAVFLVSVFDAFATPYLHQIVWSIQDRPGRRPAAAGPELAKPLWRDGNYHKPDARASDIRLLSEQLVAPVRSRVAHCAPIAAMFFTRRRWLETVASAGSALLLPRGDRVTTRSDPHQAPPIGGSPRETLLADLGWRFHLGHANDPAKDFGYGQGRMFDKVGRLLPLSRPNFDDSAWRPIDLPHDWAIELPFDNAPELNDFGYKPLGRNFPETSIGWYRRVFDIPASDAGRRIAVHFDGIFRDALVVLNGHFVGRAFSGYAPARYDVTDVIAYGGPNVLVVRVDATGREGWFYEGAGIYRHVWIEKTAPLHVADDGTFVTTATAPGGGAIVNIDAEIANDADDASACRVGFSIVDAGGRVVASAAPSSLTLGGWSRRVVTAPTAVAKPDLWSIETPRLYRLVTTIEAGGRQVDRHETTFGIRTIRWDPDAGFVLNGEHVTLKGTCNHQDHAGVGAALPDRLHEFRVARLKEMGCNAWRTAHNPPAPALLDACDRLGMVVIDETRLFSSNDEGVSQLTRMMRRDRNHPSVIAWSIANEEWSVQGNDRGTRIARSLSRTVKAIDRTRPVMAAMDSSYGKGVALGVDVHGVNYQREDIDALHRQFPTLPIVGSETASAYSTRGIYTTDAARGYVSAYDVNKPDYGATAEQWWTFFDARAFLAGGFVWTGFDYRGEPSPYKWPCISSHFGVLDTCGFPKDSFFYYKSWWTREPCLHLFPHWNWAGREGQEIDVWCHTNVREVELFLNGRSLGAERVTRNSHASWKVPYQPGVLEAREVGGRLIAQRETTGAPARIVLTPDRARLSADGEDIAVVRVQIVDGAGRVVPTADTQVRFSVTGRGRILGVGNGDPSSHEADKAESRRAFNGLCMAIVQSTKEPGEIRIEATSPGLVAATAVAVCDAVTLRPALALPS